MEGILDAIKDFISYYLSTELPNITLNGLVDIWESASKSLIEIARDYIAVLVA